MENTTSDPNQGLPPVAKSLLTYCKKCEMDRYHRVLAHLDADGAKVECEICHKKSTYRLSKGKTGGKMAAAPKAKKAKSTKSKSKKSTSTKTPSFAELKEKIGVDQMRKYRLSEKFENNSAIEHPKFGIGFIVMSADERIDAIFEDGLKVLIHNRK